MAFHRFAVLFDATVGKILFDATAKKVLANSACCDYGFNGFVDITQKFANKVTRVVRTDTAVPGDVCTDGCTSSEDRTTEYVASVDSECGNETFTLLRCEGGKTITNCFGETETATWEDAGNNSCHWVSSEPNSCNVFCQSGPLTTLEQTLAIRTSHYDDEFGSCDYAQYESLSGPVCGPSAGAFLPPP